MILHDFVCSFKSSNVQELSDLVRWDAMEYRNHLMLTLMLCSGTSRRKRLFASKTMALCRGKSYTSSLAGYKSLLPHRVAQLSTTNILSLPCHQTAFQLPAAPTSSLEPAFDEVLTTGREGQGALALLQTNDEPSFLVLQGLRLYLRE